MPPAPSCEIDGCSAVPPATVTGDANVPGAVNLRYCVTPARFVSFVNSRPGPDGPPATAGYSASHSTPASGDHALVELSDASLVDAFDRRPGEDEAAVRRTRPGLDQLEDAEHARCPRGLGRELAAEVSDDVGPGQRRERRRERRDRVVGRRGGGVGLEERIRDGADLADPDRAVGEREDRHRSGAGRVADAGPAQGEREHREGCAAVGRDPLVVSVEVPVACAVHLLEDADGRAGDDHAGRIEELRVARVGNGQLDRPAGDLADRDLAEGQRRVRRLVVPDGVERTGCVDRDGRHRRQPRRVGADPDRLRQPPCRRGETQQRRTRRRRDQQTTQQPRHRPAPTRKEPASAPNLHPPRDEGKSGRFR